MRKSIIKKGEKYNNLTAIGFNYRDKKGRQCWLFRCDCGNKKVIDVSAVKSGHTKSCGCLHKEKASIQGKKNKTHGMIKTKEYKVWDSIKQRCLNKNHKAYKNYGGRGIKVCKSWLKFENFFKDMGKRPKGLTIDRIDNNGNYEPKNCRWATMKEQSNNTRNNIFISINGVQTSFNELAGIFGIKYTTLRYRLSVGWSLEKA